MEKIPQGDCRYYKDYYFNPPYSKAESRQFTGEDIVDFDGDLVSTLAQQGQNNLDNLAGLADSDFGNLVGNVAQEQGNLLQPLFSSSQFAVTAFIATLVIGTISASIASGISHINPPMPDCPPGWTQVWTKCFYLNPNPLTWVGSRAACMSLGGDSDLASLESDIDQITIWKKLNPTGSTALASNAWIGANDIEVIQKFVWAHDGSLLSAMAWTPPWKTNQPNSVGHQHCTSVQYSDGKWNDIACTKYQPSICQRTAKVGLSQTKTLIPTCSNSCPSGWTQDGSVCNCYIIEAGPKNFANSRKACQAYGADLASVTTGTVSTLLFKLEPTKDIWVGGTDDPAYGTVEGTHIWVNGDPFSWNNWATGQPNAASAAQDYVKVKGGKGTWDDVGDAAKAYACQKSIL